jgi:hypothetical protein
MITGHMPTKHTTTGHSPRKARTCTASKANPNDNYDNDENKETKDHQCECSKNVTKYIKDQQLSTPYG